MNRMIRGLGFYRASKAAMYYQFMSANLTYEINFLLLANADAVSRAIEIFIIFSVQGVLYYQKKELCTYFHFHATVKSRRIHAVHSVEFVVEAVRACPGTFTTDPAADSSQI